MLFGLLFGWLFRLAAAVKGCRICECRRLAVVVHDIPAWGLCDCCLLNRTGESLKLLDGVLVGVEGMSYGPAAPTLRRCVKLPKTLRDDGAHLWSVMILIDALREWRRGRR